jgi:uncharacterized protein DUF6515
MNEKSLTRLGVLLLTGSLAVGPLSPRAHAVWGSVRANNRSAGEVRNAPRQAQAAPAVRGHHGESTFREGEARPERRDNAEVTRNRELRGREFVAPPREEIEREARERRHLDFDEDHRHLYFWSDYYPGYAINTLPPGYSSIYAEGNPYYYYDGVYYEPGSSGYVVVSPPLGAVVGQLPPGAQAIALGPNIYYYAGGAFYEQEPQGFVVVSPPLGATVSMLPPGATPVTINGNLYYQVDGAYFMPVMQNGIPVYTVAQP